MKGIFIILLVEIATSSFALGANVKAIPTVTNSAKMSEIASPTIINIQKDLKQLESSIEVTRKRIHSSQEIQFLPDIYFMLGELIIDKSRLMYSLKKESNIGVPTEELDFTAEKRTRLEAIETFKNIEERYPQYSNLDKVLFTIAHEYRELADPDSALKYYKKIIDRKSTNDFYPNAFIEVGNIFFEKKDFDFALENYKKVLDLPETDATGVASYKMGFCFAQKGRYLQSLKSYQKVFHFNFQENKNNVQEEALLASVWPFSEIAPDELRSNPELLNPLVFYKSASTGMSSYRRVLSRLAKRLIIKKRENEASDVWLELFRISDDISEKKEAMENFYQLGLNLKKEYYPAWVGSEIVQILTLLRSQNVSENNREKGYLIYEPLLRDLATRLHKYSMKTKRKEDLLDTIEIYKNYLWIFPQSKSNQDMKMNLAEAYYHYGDKVESGLLYLDLTRSKNNPHIKEFFDSSIQALTEAFKESEFLSTYKKSRARYGFRDLIKSFMGKYPKDPSTPTLLFNYARSLYDEQKYEDALLSLKNYIAKYPREKNTENAVMLVLDCYYVRDNLKGLVDEGTKFSNNQSLDASLRQKVSQTVQQAQIKTVRNNAGDFNSKKYADKFIEFAKNSRGSQLGEQALLEAFTSLKSSQDSRIFQIGEQYLGQFSQSTKAKEVLNSMIQLSLIYADYTRAATYLEAYSEKYNKQPESLEMKQQAAILYEQLGHFDQAAAIYFSIGKIDNGVKLNFASGHWKEVASKATQVSGVKGLFYQSMSLYRLGQISDAIPLLIRLSTEQGATPEDKEMIAQAGIVLSELEIPAFSKFGSGQAFSVQLLQSKAQNYQNIDKILQNVIAQGSGRWTIAALYFTGILNLKFSEFLKSAHSPKGMNPEQFKKMISQQIVQYEGTARDLFSNCIKVAEENDVFTRFVDGCRSPRSRAISESMLFKKHIAPKENNSRLNELRLSLSKSPRNPDILNKIAFTSVQDGNYFYAASIYQRIKEILPQDDQAFANLGTMALFKDDPEGASQIWLEVIKNSHKNVTALAGLTALYKQFGYKNKYINFSNKIKGQKIPNPIHPWMK